MNTNPIVTIIGYLPRELIYRLKLGSIDPNIYHILSRCNLHRTGLDLLAFISRLDFYSIGCDNAELPSQEIGSR